MSQTLSLEPGRYSLYITPPVAGVDFTGTPTPSVSYQWRKNGIAISGQTAATITGVWVEQSGGTVDLVDGDTISIDIILTNPVQVTTKTVSAVIDASIPAPVISPISIRLVSAPTTPVSTIPNDSIGSQIMVASTGSVNVVTTPPLLPTYQWRRGFAAIAGATSQTYTLQAADADSIIDCVVGATNSGGTTTRTATATVGTLPAAGWTELTPSADSRLIYVSNDGDDAAAANVHGRGYYLPGDPEIGADPTNPSGTIVAYRTHFEAAKRVRLSACVGEDANGFPTYGSGGPGGFPDWVLLRRGDSFTENPVFGSTEYNLGGLLGGPTSPNRGWRQDQNRIHSGTGDHRGRSVSEPAVVTAWGAPSDPRPVVNGYTVGGAARHVRVVSLDAGIIGWGWSSDGTSAGGVIIEDCRLLHVSAMSLNTMSFESGLLLRRCVVSGFFRPNNNSEGFYIRNDVAKVAIEECVFDKNGYRQDPFDATKWTASVVNINGLPEGTGAQPFRMALDRNLYLSSYESMALRGNIFSRGGGGSSVQLREGGIAERNLFIWNETALGMAHGQSRPERQKGGLAKDNVVLHDDCFLPGGSGWGAGITVGGGLDNIAVSDANIVAHFHRGNNGSQSIGVKGKPPYYDREGTLVNAPARLERGIIKDNTVYREFGGVGILVMDQNRDYGVLEAEVTGNAVSSSGTLDGGSSTVPGMLSMQGDSSKPAEFTYSGNRFHATQPGGGFRWGWSANANGDWRDAPWSQGDFSQWQAAGYDTDATLTSDFAAFKAAAGWTAPERDIVSYMESVDPTYEVNEDVYVDEDAAVKQANRQKVWEVLSNPALYPSSVWWQARALMSEARAKLTARRFHAFVTFIQRAKENRKGAWDPRWTAEAVNNYIRAGFGKAAVTGAYDPRSLADRLLDYTT